MRNRLKPRFNCSKAAAIKENRPIYPQSFHEVTMIHQAGTDKVTGASRRYKHEWGVILAGGDGTRLKPLTRKITGDERPKQFCSVLGGATLLEETQRRAALQLAKERTLYVVNRVHEPYYGQILADTNAANLVVQPCNAGTAPAILYSLLRIAAADPQAIVAFFPSDHYVSDDWRFMAHTRTALDTAYLRRNLVILLGVEPESPEVEYGWIEPTALIRGHASVFGVRRFWEKPNQVLAQVLQLRGCLWNSFVMVASVRALLEIIQSATPSLYPDRIPSNGAKPPSRTIGALLSLYLLSLALHRSLSPT